jgi:hypothetical protein
MPVRAPVIKTTALDADASRLVEKAAKKVSDTFPKGVVVKKAAPHQIEPLSSIGLYD